MTLESLKPLIPDYAKDLRLNLSALPMIASLTPAQLWGAILATALAGRAPAVIAAAEAEARARLSPAELQAAKAAAAIMAMNNIYYRSLHLLSDKDYGQLRANLRMTVLANPGVDKALFEFWSLAVSAVNGCGMCLDSHERELRRHGVAREQIHEGLRIASVMHAVSAVILGEQAMAQAA